MSKVIFDSAKVNAPAVFAFGLDPADWNALAEDALMLDAVCDGVEYSPAPTPAPAVEAEAGPTDADRAWWTAETLGSATDGFMVEGERVRAAGRPAPKPRPRTDEADGPALPSNAKRVAIVSGNRRGEPLRKMGRLWVGIESGELVSGDVVARAYRNGRLAILPDVAEEIDEDAMMMAYCEREHERMEWARIEAEAR